MQKLLSCVAHSFRRRCGLPDQLPRGMKPGLPVSTTWLYLCLVSIASIAFMASSGRRVTSKFSVARAGLFGVVSKAVPRRGPSQQDLCRCSPGPLGDRQDHRVFDRPGLHPLSQWGECKEHDVPFPASGPQGVADLPPVSIALGAIEVTETGLQRVARGDPHRLRIGYERAKAQHGNLPNAVAEGNAFPPEGVDHHCSRCGRTNDNSAASVRGKSQRRWASESVRTNSAMLWFRCLDRRGSSVFRPAHCVSSPPRSFEWSNPPRRRLRMDPEVRAPD
jgi:hypothetical protein